MLRVFASAIPYIGKRHSGVPASSPERPPFGNCVFIAWIIRGLKVLRRRLLQQHRWVR